MRPSPGAWRREASQLLDRTSLAQVKFRQRPVLSSKRRSTGYRTVASCHRQATLQSSDPSMKSKDRRMSSTCVYPLDKISEALSATMVTALENRPDTILQRVVPFEIITPESVEATPRQTVGGNTEINSTLCNSLRACDLDQRTTMNAASSDARPSTSRPLRVKSVRRHNRRHHQSHGALSAGRTRMGSASRDRSSWQWPPSRMIANLKRLLIDC